jgi:predicted Rossmann fold nucleotide-binding protein DprA/Smf involved in DNA uptake
VHIGSQAQAVLLLTVHFGKDEKHGEKPLTTSEWARFALWLKEHNLHPASLLSGNVSSDLSGLIDRSITAHRIERLLERGGALGLSLERWERAGLWILTRSDTDYPDRLKRQLRQDSPAVIFGCGNKALLNSGGIAVVGSRDATDADMSFADSIGREAATQGTSIISGGARGIDQSAMLGALQSEGTAVGVLADSLLRSATSAAYRKHLMANDLVLISPFSPEAGFNVGNAMARNKYIYCLADAAIVVSSTRNKGGTWAGAIEDLKAGWVPLWVKRSGERSSGNEDLVQQGGQYLPDPPPQLKDLSSGSGIRQPASDIPLLTRDTEPAHPREPEEGVKSSVRVEQKIVKADDANRTDIVASDQHVGLAIGTQAQPSKSLYHTFLESLIAATKDKPLSADELAQELELTKQQVAAWLKRAVADNAVTKKGRPIRYLAASREKGQPSLFGED